jgi:hypothetical protein
MRKRPPQRILPTIIRTHSTENTALYHRPRKTPEELRYDSRPSLCGRNTRFISANFPSEEELRKHQREFAVVAAAS